MKGWRKESGVQSRHKPDEWRLSTRNSQLEPDSLSENGFLQRAEGKQPCGNLLEEEVRTVCCELRGLQELLDRKMPLAPRSQSLIWLFMHHSSWSLGFTNTCSTNACSVTPLYNFPDRSALKLRRGRAQSVSVLYPHLLGMMVFTFPLYVYRLPSLRGC